MSAGIPDTRFGCVLNSVPRIEYADMQLVQVLPSEEQTAGGTAPFLAFLTAYAEAGKIEPGAIIAVDVTEWHLCSENSQPMLLDISDKQWALIYLPPCSARVLVRNSHDAFPEAVTTDENGVPKIESLTQGALMFLSLGLSLTPPKCLPESRGTAPGSKKAAARRAPKAKASDHRKSPAAVRKKS